jgi:hypothetical protein
VLGEVHARIPMVTIEEVRTLQLENAAADQRFWNGLRDMHAEAAEGNKQLAVSAERKAAEAQAGAEAACAKAEAAKDRAERLKRGETVSGGLGKKPTREDFERILRDAGWTTKDIKNAETVARLSELGGFEELLDEIGERQKRTERAAARAVLRRRLRMASPSLNDQDG